MMVFNWESLKFPELRLMVEVGSDHACKEVARMKSKTLLIAEDSVDDAFFLRRFFERENADCHVHFVEDGVEAQEYLDGVGKYADRQMFPLPLLVLTDLHMPRLDGFGLISWMKSHPRFKRMPIIMLLGSGESPDVKKAYELGVNSVLVKPVELDRLGAMMKQVLQFWMNQNRVPDPPKGE